MKKLSLFLCFVMLFTSSSLSFASPNSLDVKTKSESTISNTEELDLEPFSNKHYYVTEKGVRGHRGTKYYTALQTQDRHFLSSTIGGIMALGTPPIGPIAGFTYAIADYIYYRGLAGRLVIYRTVETRYRVNRLTGQRVKTDTFYYFEVEIFSGSNKIATHTHRARLK